MAKMRRNAGPRTARRRSKRRLDQAAAPLLAALGSVYIWLVFQTTRWRYEGREHLEAMFAEPGFIAAVWHSRLAPIAMLRPRGRRAVALISANRDGALLARIMRNMGAEAVHGSSRDPNKPEKGRGAVAGYQRSLTALRDGAILVITPDGPRGPRMRAKPGISALAAAAGKPVLPVAYSVRRAATFNSWDRFMAPYPFNRGVFVFGAPIPPAETGDDAALERHRRAVEAAMIEATMRADQMVGRATPEPGPALAAEAGA